ncbi:MAG: hypothetical protein NC355_07495 [Blautia sp.]|nr:hypothetical protein [Blautia sp.]
MFPIFTVFFIFIIVLNISLRRLNRTQADDGHRFWERELAANNTRRQDISTLDYISIPLEKIPQNLHTASEQELVALASEKLLNLADQTNTDLKLKYGVANLDALSKYDANFSRFVAVLPVYAEELIDAGQEAAARELLEFAVECRADSSKIFTMLSKLYRDAGDTDRQNALLETARSYDSLSGRIIVQTLGKMDGADG